MALTAITSLTIGEELIVHTIFGSKKYPLGDIANIGFGTETTKVQGSIPVASHLMMHIYLELDGHVQVKLNQAEAQEVVSTMDARGLGKVFDEQAA